MTYDPNDPNRTRPVDPARTADPLVSNETYVEPVERRSSALPLIIGVLLALALAYFVLQRFTGDDTVAVDGDTTTVTTTDAPATDSASDAAADADGVEAGARGAVDLEVAVLERRHERRMPGHDAEFALDPGHDDHVDVVRTNELFRRDEFEVKVGHMYPFPLP